MEFIKPTAVKLKILIVLVVFYFVASSIHSAFVLSKKKAAVGIMVGEQSISESQNPIKTELIESYKITPEKLTEAKTAQYRYLAAEYVTLLLFSYLVSCFMANISRNRNNEI